MFREQGCATLPFDLPIQVDLIASSTRSGVMGSR